MKPQDVDASLLAAEPAPERLDDGFSPPATETAAPDAQPRAETTGALPNPQSPF